MAMCKEVGACPVPAGDDVARAPGSHGDSWRQVGGFHQGLGEGLHALSASLRIYADSQPSIA